MKDAIRSFHPSLGEDPAIRPDFRGLDPIGSFNVCLEAVEKLHSRLRETKGVESINPFGFRYLHGCGGWI